jgi:hypothetical protein
LKVEKSKTLHHKTSKTKKQTIMSETPTHRDMALAETDEIDGFHFENNLGMDVRLTLEKFDSVKNKVHLNETELEVA